MSGLQPRLQKSTRTNQYKNQQNPQEPLHFQANVQTSAKIEIKNTQK